MADKIRPRFWVLAAIVLAVAALRLLPYLGVTVPLWNFSPVAALALFAGAHFERKRWAFVLPLMAMFAGDVALGVLAPTTTVSSSALTTQIVADPGLEELPPQTFHAVMPVVYATFAAVVGIGLLLRERRRPMLVASAAVASSVLFYVTTNFAHWALTDMYPKTLAGLGSCYVLALPFFGLTLAGDLVYTGALFGVFALAEKRFPALAPVRSQTA